MKTIRLLISDEDTKNPRSDLPWSRKETDCFLEAHLTGELEEEMLAYRHKRNRYAVHRRKQAFRYNEGDVVKHYEPLKRKSREGCRWTRAEREVVRCHRKRGFPVAWTAKVLQRPEQEVCAVAVPEEKELP